MVEKIIIGLSVVLLFLLALTVFAFLTMWAWNLFVVPVFGLPVITLWQGLAAWTLLRLLNIGISDIKYSKK